MKSLTSGQHFPSFRPTETKWQVTHVKSPIWPKIQLIQDFMAILKTCKSDEDSIKNEIAIVRTTIYHVYETLKGSYFHANSQK